MPTIWLYGKTGSGKTSIIRYLTGATDAEIGTGFRPCTKQARIFSFPDDELPIVRFLDTRGLGEANYDPIADSESASEESHLIIVTCRASDHATKDIVQPFRKIRRDHPKRPVLLALTCLHDHYPGEQHPKPDPFDAEEVQLPKQLPEQIPDDLKKSLTLQLKTWKGLYDRTVAIDLTQPFEGYDEPDYGGARLKSEIVRLMPSAYRQKLIELDKLNRVFSSAHQQKAQRIIFAHSLTAASAAAVPLPWLDIPFVLGVQSFLAHRLGKLNNHKLDAATMAKVTAALGSRVALRMGMRAALKFIPFVGSVANASAAFGVTYATGWAWNWYFKRVNEGHVPTSRELRDVYRDELSRATTLWKTAHRGDHD